MIPTNIPNILPLVIPRILPDDSTPPVPVIYEVSFATRAYNSGTWANCIISLTVAGEIIKLDTSMGYVYVNLAAGTYPYSISPYDPAAYAADSGTIKITKAELITLTLYPAD